MLPQTADASAFLSTATLIIGVFLTVTIAALASSLPNKLEELTRPLDRKNRDDWYARFIRFGLFILIVTNTIGTIFLSTLLAINTMRPILDAWIWVGFSYLIYVILINLSAVSAIFIGPMSARKRRAARSAAAVRNSKNVIPALEPSGPARNEDIPPPAPRLRWRTPLIVACGIAVGLIAGTRFKRLDRG
jgi:hypothetical protein